MRSLQEEVRECVQVLETRTTEIFSELAQACSLERTGETVDLLFRPVSYTHLTLPTILRV